MKDNDGKLVDCQPPSPPAVQPQRAQPGQCSISSAGAPPVRWAGPSSSARRPPFSIDTSHPLWQRFLNSGTLSPAQFFKVFLQATPTYFQSPTPWSNPASSRNSTGSRYVQKVQELLENFRPGTSMYRPFQRNKASSRLMPRQFHPFRVVDVDQRLAPTHSPPLIVGSRGQDRLRTLYADSRRPRPYCRRTALEVPSDSSLGSSDPGRLYQPPSLQKLVAIALVKSFGVDGLFRRLYRLPEEPSMTTTTTTAEDGSLGYPEGSLPGLPQGAKDRLLTFVCEDFEEITSCEPPTTGSFGVRCLYDGRSYLATFITSEADKHFSNVWEELRATLEAQRKLGDDLVQGLALVADTLTENIFLLTQLCPVTFDTYMAKSRMAGEEEARNVEEATVEKFARILGSLQAQGLLAQARRIADDGGDLRRLLLTSGLLVLVSDGSGGSSNKGPVVAMNNPLVLGQRWCRFS